MRSRFLKPVYQNIFSGLFGGAGGTSHGANGATPIPAFQAPAGAAPVMGGNQQPTGTQPAAPTTPDSPLDSLKSFWDTPKDAEGKEVQPTADPLSQSIYNFDPKKITDSARKLDFTSGMNPETITKALGGDPQAFMDAINHAAQTAFAAATLNTGKLINDGHTTNNQRFASTLPTQIKRVQLSQTETSNPILQHAAAQPLVEALKAMAFAKDPNANPADVTRSVEALLVGLGTAIAAETPEAVGTRKRAASQEQDWSSFLS